MANRHYSVAYCPLRQARKPPQDKGNVSKDRFSEELALGPLEYNANPSTKAGSSIPTVHAVN
jgi:hypothetical protein